MGKLIVIVFLLLVIIAGSTLTNTDFVRENAQSLAMSTIEYTFEYGSSVDLETESGSAKMNHLVRYPTIDTKKTGESVYELTSDSGSRMLLVVHIIDTQFPIITGAESKTITVGDSLEGSQALSARDPVDGVLPLSSEGHADPDHAGIYVLRASATDSNGNQTVIAYTITVNSAHDSIIDNEGASAHVRAQGD